MGKFTIRNFGDVVRRRITPNAALKTRKIGGLAWAGILILGAVLSRIGNLWTTPGDILNLLTTMGVWILVPVAFVIVIWANWPEIKRRSPWSRHTQTLIGTRDHAAKMLNDLPTARKRGSLEMFDLHLKTVFVAAGNGLHRTRELGVFDDNVDLLNILDGVDKNEYPEWQTGNQAYDRFLGFWFWLKSHGDPGESVRGDYRTFTLRTFIDLIDIRLTGETSLRKLASRQLQAQLDERIHELERVYASQQAPLEMKHALESEQKTIMRLLRKGMDDGLVPPFVKIGHTDHTLLQEWAQMCKWLESTNEGRVLKIEDIAEMIVVDTPDRHFNLSSPARQPQYVRHAIQIVQLLRSEYVKPIMPPILCTPHFPQLAAP